MKGDAKRGRSSGRKDSRIEVRVSPPEEAAFREASEIAGVGLSTWIRERLRRAATRELEEADRIAPFLLPPKQES